MDREKLIAKPTSESPRMTREPFTIQACSSIPRSLIAWSTGE
jgi:hypothetical protein